MISGIKRYFALRRISRRNKEIQDELMRLIREQGDLTDEQKEKYLTECEELLDELNALDGVKNEQSGTDSGV